MNQTDLHIDWMLKHILKFTDADMQEVKRIKKMDMRNKKLRRILGEKNS